MSLGTNIRTKRKSLKLSQEYVAEQMQVSRQAISKWEMGQSEPSTNNLIKLSELFSCDVSELISPEKYREEGEVEVSQESNNEKVVVKNYYFSFMHLILTLILFSTAFISNENAILITTLFLLIVNISCFYSEYLVIKYFEMNQHKKIKKRYVLFMMTQIFITTIIFIVMKFLF